MTNNQINDLINDLMNDLINDYINDLTEKVSGSSKCLSRIGTQPPD